MTENKDTKDELIYKSIYDQKCIKQMKKTQTQSQEGIKIKVAFLHWYRYTGVVIESVPD